MHDYVSELCDPCVKVAAFTGYPAYQIGHQLIYAVRGPPP